MPSSTKPDLRSLGLSELQEKLRDWNEPAYRAEQIAAWLYQKRAKTFDLVRFCFSHKILCSLPSAFTWLALAALSLPRWPRSW